jgi:glycosyltransferase involved in cell wall biosynthesis
MISVIIPTMNSARHLPAAFLSIYDAAIDGLVSEVIVSDGGSDDATLAIAGEAGATVVTGPCDECQQLRRGAEAARRPWLLFLHANTRLESGWAEEAKAFIARGQDRAAIFRFKLSGGGLRPRLLETVAVLRSSLFRLPPEEQALLISRNLYEEIGGFAPLTPGQADLIRRLGRKRIVRLRSAAITGAAIRASRYSTVRGA